MNKKTMTPSMTNIDRWNSLINGNDENRLQKVKDIFAKAGNYFILDTGNISADSHYNYFHVYFGLDDADTLKLYVLPKEDDKDIDIYTLNLIPIPPFGTDDKVVDPFANRQDLIQDINAWQNLESRNSWLDVNHNALPWAFCIDASDFNPGDVHACYFAIRNNKEYGKLMDLVIANTGAKDIPSLIKEKKPYDKSSVFKDMARPVPPFGNNYGILIALGIMVP